MWLKKTTMDLVLNRRANVTLYNKSTEFCLFFKKNPYSTTFSCAYNVKSVYKSTLLSPQQKRKKGKKNLNVFFLFYWEKNKLVRSAAFVERRDKV